MIMSASFFLMSSQNWLAVTKEFASRRDTPFTLCASSRNSPPDCLSYFLVSVEHYWFKNKHRRGHQDETPARKPHCCRFDSECTVMFFRRPRRLIALSAKRGEFDKQLLRRNFSPRCSWTLEKYPLSWRRSGDGLGELTAFSHISRDHVVLFEHTTSSITCF